MFGAELFGIPVIPLILIVIWAIASAQEQRDKARKAAEELWRGISCGMSKTQVVGKLGRPHGIVPGIPEAWFYEFKDLRGAVMFEKDVVVGFQTPQ
jgi:outer membrane protein assembly factor BamE (lipoprotein component of BamABCDE complex)